MSDSAFRRRAARYEAKVRRQLAAAVRAGNRRLNRAEIRKSYPNAGRMISRLRPFVDGYAGALLPLEDVVSAAFAGGWRFAGTTDADPSATTWIERASAEAIVNLATGTRQGVFTFVAGSLKDALPTSVFVRLSFDVLGLTDRQVAAVLNLRRRLMAAAPGTTVAAGSVNLTIPETGVTEPEVGAWTSEYAQRLLLERADTVARTLTVYAVSAGQQAGWEAGVSLGVLPASQRKRWLLSRSERTCPICRALDGQIVGLFESFQSPDAGRLPYPPAHPNCRCSVVLVG